jgi:peptidoglycan/LPS O-acetylase OafA/YrhL
MEKVLEYRNETYGFLALWILFFHVKMRVDMAVSIPIITSFIEKGNFAVDVFLFLSGLCLCLSLKRDDNMLHFYTKRFKRVVVTYLIIAIPFFIWKSLEEVPSNGFAHFFYDISGLSFWFSGCQNAWFVEAILLFYIITPPIFRVVRQSIVASIVLLLLVYALNAIAFYAIPLYKHSAVAWTRLPIFIIGIIIAYYWPHFDVPNRKPVIAGLLIFSLVFLYFVPDHLSGFLNWQLYALMVLPFLAIISETFIRIPESVRNLFSKLGLVSLEIYLVHIMTLHVFTFYGLNKQIGQWMYLLLPSITLPISLLVPHISSYILFLNKSNRKHN